MSAPFPTLDTIFSGMLDRYRAHVPNVDRVIRAMVAGGLIRDAADIEFAERAELAAEAASSLDVGWSRRWSLVRVVGPPAAARRAEPGRWSGSLVGRSSCLPATPALE